MADDVTGVNEAAGLFELIGEDREDFALVGELGRDEFRLGELRGRLNDGCCRRFWGLGLEGAVLGLLSFCGHEAKVSSCI